MAVSTLMPRLKNTLLRTRSGKVATVSAVLAVLGYLSATLRLLPAFLWKLCALLLFLVLLRQGALWLKRRFMWRLRNRLIVAYIFIAIVPILLLGTMAFLTVYLFSGQFASFAVASGLNAEMRNLASYGEAMALHPTTLDGGNGREAALFQQNRLIAASSGGGSLTLPGAAGGKAGTAPQGISFEDGQLSLRALLPLSGNRQLVVSETLDNKRLEALTQGMGVIEIYAPRSLPPADSPDGEVFADILASPPVIAAGTLPQPASRLDISFHYGARNDATDWHSGRPVPLLLYAHTRPSLLYDRLFLTLGENTHIVMTGLMVIAVFFGIIEAIALFIGIRLSRTMTASVAELYTATEHINKGRLSHRIQVKRNDQLAALEHSFNSMAASLEDLLAEQKEKHRIDSELAIAHEVQALLFPSDRLETEGLEVHGICRPARTVSGDYYDYLPLGQQRLGLAVGDISGKGISAALLMATVHAFVRAYTLGSRAPQDGGVTPSGLLATLNNQLYEATPQEKYATLFVGIYDQHNRSLTYSNAGHLPPLLVGPGGTLRRLDAGGTVVGLFPDMEYPQQTVTLAANEILVAYSDGITEPENEFGEFGEERLVELIQENRQLPLERISAIVMAAVDDWRGAEEQSDDITLVLARAR